MRRKPVHIFLLHAAFLLALIGVLPDSRDIYPRVFHAAGNSLLDSMGDGLSVRFQWIDPPLRADAADTRMIGREAGMLGLSLEGRVQRLTGGASGRRRRSLALMLATPMSRRRLAVALPVGLLLFNGFFLLQVAALAWVLFARHGVDGAAVLGGVGAGPCPSRGRCSTRRSRNFALVFVLWAWLARSDARRRSRAA